MLWNVAIVVGVILLAVIAAVLAFAAFKPNVFRVQRSASINASPERLFALLSDFRHWAS